MALMELIQDARLRLVATNAMRAACFCPACWMMLGEKNGTSEKT